MKNEKVEITDQKFIEMARVIFTSIDHYRESGRDDSFNIDSIAEYLQKEIKEYAIQEMVSLVRNIQHRPIDCYSQKVKGQDKQFFLGRIFCEDLITSLKK
jgi:hypothetical protein